MRIEVLDARKFSTVVGNLSYLVDDAVLEFTGEGLRIEAFNKTHTMFISAQIDENAFDGLNTLNEPLDVCVDTGFIAKVLKRTGKEPITIEKGVLHNLIITTVSDNPRRFVIPIIENESEALNSPQIDYTVEFDMNYDFLKNVMDDIRITTTDKITFHITNDGVGLYGLTEMAEKTIAHYHPEEWDYQGEGFRTSYALEFLDTLMKFKLSGKIHVQIGDDMPLTCTMTDVFDVYHVSFLIAPRLEEYS